MSRGTAEQDLRDINGMVDRLFAERDALRVEVAELRHSMACYHEENNVLRITLAHRTKERDDALGKSP